MLKNFEKQFTQYCISENLEINSNQLLVVKELEKFYNKNFKSFFLFGFKKIHKKSFYLHGDVGVGKTMILDFFF